MWMWAWSIRQNPITISLPLFFPRSTLFCEPMLTPLRPLGLILFSVWIFALCTAQSTGNITQDFACKPFGLCEKCPEEALHQPFCQPFGNRRLLHCRRITSNSSSTPSASGPESNNVEPSSNDNDNVDARPHYAQRPPSLDDSPPPADTTTPQGEILAWGSCGRVTSTERADFFEFAAVNLLFVCVGVAVVVWRLSRMRVLHARQLAARIGLVRGRR
ncbi:hypothetical protein P691DRAFT_737092 [Macrolepiota fuliginosa MF-IS2]|uniref:Uncharacterized protein n=1 Tax=Macrolepiota fuliginosa MF-IS2 TaxID=1400762 RepID=A0A9P5X3R4_9AGAR|nr:hypothetical protein P691DRAFT_737092 [Macrolepiota fuliginosa MF-IS2]